MIDPWNTETDKTFLWHKEHDFLHKSCSKSYMDWTLDLDQDSDQDLDLELGPDLELDKIIFQNQIINKIFIHKIILIKIF